MTTPTDIIKQAINFELSNVHTCLPATIISYDYTIQKASVQPSLDKRYKGATEQGVVMPMPILTNVPVIFPRTSDFLIHFPVKDGDRVVLLFSERSIDKWLSNGKQDAPLDPRKFDLSDAIAICGLYPFNETSLAEDNENFFLKFGDSRIKISSDGKYCVHGETEELFNIIDELFTLLTQATVGSFGSPFLNLIDFQTLQTRFNTLKGNC